jgi:UDP-galactopyranose mutase
MTIDAMTERHPSTVLPDILCFSHLPWQHSHSRPRELMTRLARQRRVFFIEEPSFSDCDSGWSMRYETRNLRVIQPRLNDALRQTPQGCMLTQERLLLELASHERVQLPILWYNTSRPRTFSTRLRSSLVVYDCAEAPSTLGPSPEYRSEDCELLRSARLVFTGVRSLYEALRHQHANVHLFPNSLDVSHFAHALNAGDHPPDQAAIPHPRIGYLGPIDSRLDLGLLQQSAAQRPGLQFVLLGPIVGLEPATLPRAPNIWYLGEKSYAQLPDYLRGWDAAILPLLRNQATRFMCPSQVPEYLAAGRPIVSTSLRDVVRPYAQLGLVRLADEPTSFARAIGDALAGGVGAKRAAVSALLASTSWQRTADRISLLLRNASVGRAIRSHRIGRSSVG